MEVELPGFPFGGHLLSVYIRKGYISVKDFGHLLS